MDNTSPTRLLASIALVSVDTMVMVAARPIYNTREKCMRLEMVFFTFARPSWHLMQYIDAMQIQPTRGEIEAYNLTMRNSLVINLEKVRKDRGYPTQLLCHVINEGDHLQNLVDGMIKETRQYDITTFWYCQTNKKNKKIKTHNFCHIFFISYF